MGVGPGRSGVLCAENFELKLFIHDERFLPSWPARSELLRARRPGRLGSDLLVSRGGNGVGVEGIALVESLAGWTGVGGVTLGGDGSFVRPELVLAAGCCCLGVFSESVDALTSRRTSGEDWVCLCE